MNPLMTQLGVALRGDFDEEVAEGYSRTVRAFQAATFEFADEVQSAWRADVGQSGLARAEVLTKTIRTRKYRNQGLNAAALVYSTFPVIQHAFESDTLIRSKEGAFLTIPNPAVWPAGRVQRGRRSMGRQGSVAIAERRFGPLRFIYRRDKPSLLVAEVRTSQKTGAFRRMSDTGRQRGTNATTIIVFFLVRQARLPRMLRGGELRRRAERNAPGRIGELFVKHFEADVQGTRLLTNQSGD